MRHVKLASYWHGELPQSCARIAASEEEDAGRSFIHPASTILFVEMVSSPSDGASHERMVGC